MFDARRNLSTKIFWQTNIGRWGRGISSVKFDHRQSGYILSMIVGNFSLSRNVTQLTSGFNCYISVWPSDVTIPHKTAGSEDEIHFLLICPAYEEIRKQYINSKFLLNRNQINFNKLMNTHEIDNLRNLARYLRIAFQRREKILNTCAVEMEHLSSVVSASEV